MPSFNKVILMGNLTADPELRFLPSGKAVCNFTLGINRIWTNEAGEKQEEVSFVDITTFGNAADNLAKHRSKGSCVHVEGRLKQETWDDKKTGQKRSRLRVLSEYITYIGPNDPKTEHTPKSSAPATAPESADDDDVPF